MGMPYYTAAYIEEDTVDDVGGPFHCTSGEKKENENCMEDINEYKKKAIVNN